MRLGQAAVLGQLSGALAHELKQPLASILGNAEAALLILSGNVTEPTELRAILHDIIRESERAAQVIQHLRDLLCKGEVRRQQININTVVEEVLELARGELVTRNVSVATDLDAHLPLAIADRIQVQQVVLNLVMNACDAMAATPSSNRRLLFKTGLASQPRFVELTITDGGCGITASDIECIFQPFVSTKPHGLGLGLALSRLIAEAHHGRLWAENAACGGAIFHLTLPIGVLQ